jgi:hypothetical protein
VRLDTRRPVVEILSAIARARTKVVVNVNERARLRVWFGPVTWRDGDVVTVNVPAGTSAVSDDGVSGGVRVVAWDVAENRSAAVTARVERG